MPGGGAVSRNMISGFEETDGRRLPLSKRGAGGFHGVRKKRDGFQGRTPQKRHVTRCYSTPKHAAIALADMKENLTAFYEAEKKFTLEAEDTPVKKLQLDGSSPLAPPRQECPAEPDLDPGEPQTAPLCSNVLRS